VQSIAGWTDEQAREHLLSSTREDMYRTLELFYMHVKHTISLLFALIIAVSVALGFVAKDTSTNQHMLQLAKTGSVILLLLAIPFGGVSMLITGRYYRLYVAALAYATELHSIEGVAGHQYFQDFERERARLGPSASRERLISWRTYSWPHTWLLYALLIGCISLSAGVFGIMVALSL
jgi:hypothetical protein